MHSIDCIHFHVSSQSTNDCANMFGHINSIIHLKEGYIAKTFDILEYKFYEAAYNEFQSSPNTNLEGLIPEFKYAAILFRKSLKQKTPINQTTSEKYQFKLFQTKNPNIEVESEIERKRNKKFKAERKAELNPILPLIDDEEVLAYIVDNDDDLIDENRLISQLNSKYHLDLHDRENAEWKSLLVNGNSSIFHSLFIIQADLSAQFQFDMNYQSHPISTLDVKVGTRSWGLLASQKKRERREKRIARLPNGEFKFRIRGATYQSLDETNSNCFFIIPRVFYKSCTRDEVVSVLKSFFKYKEHVQTVVQKLERIKNAISVLEDQYKVRFYSSSIVFMYNDQLVQNEIVKQKVGAIECRLIDFEKAYIHVDQEIKSMNIPLEECDDNVVNAIDNFINLLKSFI